MRLATVGVANLCGFVLTGAQQHTESSAAFRVDSSARSSLISLSRSLLLVLNSASIASVELHSILIRSPER